MLLMCWW